MQHVANSEESDRFDWLLLLVDDDLSLRYNDSWNRTEFLVIPSLVFLDHILDIMRLQIGTLTDRTNIQKP